MLRPPFLIGLAIALLLPATAAATTTVEGSGNTVFVEGDAEANAITVSEQDEYVVISEAGRTVSDTDDTDGCEQDGDRVRCTTLTTLEIVRVRGNDGNDTLTADTAVVLVLLQGLGGSDTLRSAAGAHGLKTEMSGGEGNDTLEGRAASLDADDTGGPGDDLFRGGTGSDLFKQEAGADTYLGGGPLVASGQFCFETCPPRDHIAYATGPVTVTLDGLANDGAAGEADNVHADVENVLGTPAADTIDAAGAAGAHRFDGSLGDDRLTGGPDGDVLHGSPGSDTLAGLGGEDDLYPGNEEPGLRTPDFVDGGDGDDHLWDGGGPEDLVGGPGRDTVVFGDFATNLPFEITIDDQPNDGGRGAGDGDNVHTDVEVVVTASGDDRIIGSAAPEELVGGPGNDEIDGRGGVDVIDGGYGVDTLFSRDLGFDLVNCGEGVDPAVQGDEGDRLDNCEASALTPLPPPPDTTRPQLTLSGVTRISARAFARSRGVTVTARTSETSALLGEAVVRGKIARAGELVIGEKKLALANAGTRKIRIRFRRSDVRAINKRLRKRAFKLTVRVTATDAAGNRTSSSRRITIRRR